MSGSVLLPVALVAIGIAIALLVITLAPASQGEGGVAAALSSIEKRYGASAAAAAGRSAAPATSLPGWLHGLAVRLSFGDASGRLQHQLDLAGNPNTWNVDRLLAFKGLGLIVGGLIGLLFGVRVNIMLAVLLVVLGGAIGFFMPDILVYNAGIKRQEKIQKQLPDAMDMLTVCVESGLGFDAALAQVARNTEGPLAAELARALQEMQIGKTRREALRSLADRTTVPELRSFVSSLVQAGELGISVAGVLREAAKEMRLRRRQRAEELAQKVPVKILFPLMLCLLPALFIVIMGPAVVTVFHIFLHK
jgi:tight adherence protein C